MFRTEMLDSGAAPALCSMVCSEMLLMVHGGVWDLGNPRFAAWSVVYHCLLQTELRFRGFLGKPCLLLRL